MKSGSFFGELKRRNVYKVAVPYAVVGWLLIQVATQVFPFLDIPNWAIRLVSLLTALGFLLLIIVYLGRFDDADRQLAKLGLRAAS